LCASTPFPVRSCSPARAAIRASTGAPRTPGLLSPWRDARNVDPYGESYTPAQLTKLGKSTNLSFTPAFLSGDAGWKGALAQVDGARFVQVRITFLSNAATLEEPHLSGLGLAFGF